MIENVHSQQEPQPPHPHGRTWKLNVQGIVLSVDSPTIEVRDALQRAGLDVTRDWIIVLRVAGEPKQFLTLEDTIDLRRPGIEKLRVTPKGVNNGEAPFPHCRQFALLERDDRFLAALGLPWETVVDAGRRWLLLREYPVPAGYQQTNVTLALEIPEMYPMAQIDMFYTAPALALSSGQAIPSTQVSATIAGIAFNGWSRHRGPEAPWDAALDGVMTHLGLVDEAIAKEVAP